MKFLILLMVLTALFACSGSESKEDSQPRANWSKESRERHLLNRQNPITWDMKMFRLDLKYMDDERTGPFSGGVFPVPRYDLTGKGSFTGVGSFGYFGQKGYVKKIEDKKILFNSFFVRKNSINNKYLSPHENEVFFQIIVLTDYIDREHFSHVSSEMISRNHPDYLGQGYFKTSIKRIDYTAFITAERTSYAIINNRLFDLNFGKTILIAPQRDRSLRSMQIKSPHMSKDEIDKYTDQLLQNEIVIRFFTKEGNI